MSIELILIVVVCAVILFALLDRALKGAWHDSVVRPQLDVRARNTRNIDLLPEETKGSWIRQGRQSPFSSVPDNTPDWKEYFELFNWSWGCSVLVALFIVVGLGILYLLV